MTRDELERALHEYLDGRMPARDRVAFEARVAADPELAQRLEFHRAVGHALRSPLPGPRPGFAARARARFEARARRRAGWGSVLRWEAAGLVAAGVLLALLVLPTRREAEGVVAPAVSTSAQTQSVRELDDEATNAPSPAESAPSPPAKKKASSVVAEAPAPPAPRAPAVTDNAESAAGSVAFESRQEEKQEKEVQAQAGGKYRADALAGAADARAKSDAAFVGRATTLPRGAVPAESIERIDPAASDLSKDIQETTRNAVMELQPIRGREEVILIGARATPVSCDGYRVEISRESLRIVLSAPSPGQREAPGGCAVVVPASSLPIIIEDPSDAGR